MAVKVVCDFCDKPLELEDGRYVIYHTKQLNTRKIFKHLCKNCSDKLDMVIKLTETQLEKDAKILDIGKRLTRRAASS